MTFKEYERLAAQTAVYPGRGNNLVYPVLGLTGESGEVAEKVKKLIRDKNYKISETFKEDIKKELGDVLWYIAAICYELGLSMEDVAKTNIEKLASRKARDRIHGEGDNR